MERIAGAVLVCMLHLIYTCVLDQHFIGCSLSGNPECNAMAISMADVPNPSPYDDHLPESLAPACELGHDHHLHYLREFNPNDEFLTSDVLRHNFDMSVGDSFSGKYNHADDGYFLGNFEVHALFETYLRLVQTQQVTTMGDLWIIPSRLRKIAVPILVSSPSKPNTAM